MKFFFILSTFLSTLVLVDAQTFWTQETKLKGTVGKYPIFMSLAVPVGGANRCFTIGTYYYLSTRKPIDLCSSDDEVIVEKVDGKETGYFILKNWNKRIGQTVVGSWHSSNGRKRYPVILKVVDKGPY